MDAAELLGRHLPVLRFDSRERYFPLSAAAWTDCPGHELRRADGTLIAGPGPGSGTRLRLDLLARYAYRDGTPVRDDDVIVSPGRDYLAKAERLQADPAYADRVYGHVTRGSDGRLWLQYRWFYFFNDYRLFRGRVAVGVHEGDWEMIQLRLDPSGSDPDTALYLHHRAVERRSWTEMTRIGSRPVVYVARGSHGCYFTPGTRWTGTWFDHADGERRRCRQHLEVIGADTAFAWAWWPGAWGGTRPRSGFRGRVDARSPDGPAGPRQLRWADPAVLLERAR